MKEMLRNPMFYYVAIPLCVAVWPASVWIKYLPTAEKDVVDWSERKVEAEKLMVRILQLDPSRPGDNPTGEKVVFSYANAVERVAPLCGIRSQTYKVSTQPRMGGSGGKPETQGAAVGLSTVSIEQTANFIWKIRLQWPGLECTRVELKHKKGEKDVWDVDLKFAYEF